MMEWPSHFYDPSSRGVCCVSLVHRAPDGDADGDDDNDTGRKPISPSTSGKTSDATAAKTVTGTAAAASSTSDLTDEMTFHYHAMMSPMYNQCRRQDPHVVFTCEDNATNSLPAAYTSNGYPSVTGQPPSVYNAFSDLKCVSIQTIDLPPNETIVVGKAATGAGASSRSPGGVAAGSGPAHRGESCDMEEDLDLMLDGFEEDNSHQRFYAGGSGPPPPLNATVARRTHSGTSNSRYGRDGCTAEMDTLLHIRWNRAGNVFHGKPKSVTQPPPPCKLETLSQYLQRFPDGIHAIQTSDHITRLIVDGDLPCEGEGVKSAFTQCFPPSIARMPPNATASGAPPPAPKPAATAATIKTTSTNTDNNKPATVTTTTTTTTAAASPPPPAPAAPTPVAAAAPLWVKSKAPSGSAPVQHSLTSVNTYSHLTVYFTAHQDGRVLMHTPVQTYCASIATRKITAHKLLLLARQDPSPYVSNASSSLRRSATAQPHTASASASASGPGDGATHQGRGDSLDSVPSVAVPRSAPIATPKKSASIPVISKQRKPTTGTGTGTAGDSGGGSSLVFESSHAVSIPTKRERRASGPVGPPGGGSPTITPFSGFPRTPTSPLVPRSGYPSSPSHAHPLASSSHHNNTNNNNSSHALKMGGGIHAVNSCMTACAFAEVPISEREQAVFCPGATTMTMGTTTSANVSGGTPQTIPPPSQRIPPPPALHSSAGFGAFSDSGASTPKAGSTGAVGGGTTGSVSPSGFPKFRGVDPVQHTISVVPCVFTLAPMILVGNQNGDLILTDVLEREIVCRLNYAGNTTGSGNNTSSTGVGSPTSSRDGSSSPGTATGKLIEAAVTCICEVESGIEKCVSALVHAAAAAKREEDPFGVIGAGTSGGGGTFKDPNQGSVAPSLYAVGFEDGQMLLVCFMCEGGWMLRHFAHQFGAYPIEDIAVRCYDFFMRLWVSYDPANSTSATMTPESSITSNPRGDCGGNRSHHSNSNSNSNSNKLAQHSGYGWTCTITVDNVLSTLQDSQLAAVACGAGSIMLVHLPEMEILHAISVHDYNAVGSIQALRWLPSQRDALLAPDLLIASGEDDTLTSFYLAQTTTAGSGTPPTTTRRSPLPLAKGNRPFPSSVSTGGAPLHHHHHNNSSSGNWGAGYVCRTSSGLGSASSFSHLSLRVLEKKAFHRSWVSSLGLLPLVVPMSRGGGGMPKYHGVILMASSYDGSVSFWPHFFPALGATSAMTTTSGGGGGASGVATTPRAAKGNTGVSPPHVTSSPSLLQWSEAPSSSSPSPQRTPAAHVAKSPSTSSSAHGGTFPSAAGIAQLPPLFLGPSATLPTSQQPQRSSVDASGGRATGDGRLLLINGPTSVYRLHTELVMRVLACGAGTSFFVVSACCRGKVKAWSINLKE